MEKKLFEVGNVLVNDGGTEVVVYEVTESFVFVAPLVRQDGKFHIITQKTVVYENDNSKEVFEPVHSITIVDRGAEVQEEGPAAAVPVVDAEVVEDCAEVNEALLNWQTNGEFLEKVSE